MMATFDEYIKAAQASAPQGTYGQLTGYTPQMRIASDGESSFYTATDPTTGQRVVQDNSGRWRYQVPEMTETGMGFGWGGYADVGNIPTQFNTAGDMYRVATTDPSRFWGGAGAPHAYDYYKYVDPTADQIANGAWQLTNPGEHYEGEQYFWQGANAAPYLSALQEQFAGTLDPIEQARLSAPEALGQAIARPDLVGLNSLGQSGAELAFYDPNLLSNVGITLTPEQQAARAAQIAGSTPQAQDDGDGDFLGGLAPLLLAGAGMYFGLPSLGSLFGEGALGALGAAEAGAGGLSWLGNAGLASIPEAVAAFNPAVLGAVGATAAGNAGSSGLSWLGNEGLASIPEAVGSFAPEAAGSGSLSWLGNEGLPSISDAVNTSGLEGFELGGEGVGTALDTGLSLNPTGLPYGQTLANSTLPIENSIIGQNAITSGANGYLHVDPLSSGSITGVSGLPSSGAMEALSELGIDTSAMSGAGAAAAGTASAAPTLLERLLANPLNTLSTAANISTAGRAWLSEATGIPENILGGGLGILSALAAIQSRNAANANTNAARANQYSSHFTSGLNPTAWAGPQMRNVMGATPSIPRQNVTPTWNQPLVGSRLWQQSPMLLPQSQSSLQRFIDNMTTPVASGTPVIENPYSTTTARDILGNSAASGQWLKQLEAGGLGRQPTQQPIESWATMPAQIDTSSEAGSDVMIEPWLAAPNQGNFSGLQEVLNFAKGGGALSRMSNNTAGPSMGGYAAGGTKGQDDKIPALLSDGEYVFDADSVAALGDGNNAAGAAVLDKMRENIRRHKRSAPANKIPPKAKSPEAYLKGAR